MSIRATIEKKKATFSISRSYPDRVSISDPVVAEGYGNFLNEGSRKPYIYLSDIWRHPRSDSASDDNLDLPFPADIETEIPEWIELALAESKWAHDRVFYGGESVAWRVDRRIVIQGKFTLTLSERISALDAASVFYSRKMNSKWHTALA